MDIKNLINDMVKAGFSEAQIVAKLKGKGFDTTQSTLNRIKRDEFKRFQKNFSLGLGIVELHQEICRESNIRTVKNSDTSASEEQPDMGIAA